LRHLRLRESKHIHLQARYQIYTDKTFIILAQIFVRPEFIRHGEHTLCYKQYLVLNSLSSLLSYLTYNYVRGVAGKFLARPGRKQATATKFGISTYSPRRSIHVLVRCSNFCKPLKKIQKAVRPTKSPRQQ